MSIITILLNTEIYFLTKYLRDDLQAGKKIKNVSNKIMLKSHSKVLASRTFELFRKCLRLSFKNEVPGAKLIIRRDHSSNNISITLTHPAFRHFYAHPIPHASDPPPVYRRIAEAEEDLEASGDQLRGVMSVFFPQRYYVGPVCFSVGNKVSVHISTMSLHTNRKDTLIPARLSYVSIIKRLLTFAKALSAYEERINELMAVEKEEIFEEDHFLIDTETASITIVDVESFEEVEELKALLGYVV